MDSTMTTFQPTQMCPITTLYFGNRFHYGTDLPHQMYLDIMMKIFHFSNQSRDIGMKHISHQLETLHQEEHDCLDTYIALVPRGGELPRRWRKLILSLGEQTITRVHLLIMDGVQMIHHHHHQHKRNKKLSTKKNLQMIATWNLRHREH